jgi:hypothetical protein
MNSPEVKKFIREHSNLFWYIPGNNKEDISEEVLIEFTLNYCELNEIKRLIKILGLKKIAETFFSAHGRKKLNYYPEIHNFFSLLFNKYAQRDI